MTKQCGLCGRQFETDSSHFSMKIQGFFERRLNRVGCRQIPRRIGNHCKS